MPNAPIKTLPPVVTTPPQGQLLQWIADPLRFLHTCTARYRQIHTLYDNSHLALHLNTLEKLKQDPQLQKFLSWVYKQDPNKRVKMDRKR
ncbi:HNH endonuclease [Leptolyngbya sp. PL-A3]|uniref:hypothetical protein n=1 Tax=Leptolyngbya sp. PL-A3 TaxID=2933911 RepID=UPI001747763A|nr:hypothetical protein [Phormidium tenue FACHB-886]